MEINSLTLSGNLTSDPELKYLPSGVAVCAFAIGHNKVYYKDEEKHEEAYFFYVHTYGKVAETVAKHMKKGSGVIIEGSLKQERWESEDGTKREKVRVVARRVNFMLRKETE